MIGNLQVTKEPIELLKVETWLGERDASFLRATRPGKVAILQAGSSRRANAWSGTGRRRRRRGGRRSANLHVLSETASSRAFRMVRTAPWASAICGLEEIRFRRKLTVVAGSTRWARRCVRIFNGRRLAKRIGAIQPGVFRTVIKYLMIIFDQQLDNTSLWASFKYLGIEVVDDVSEIKRKSQNTKRLASLKRDIPPLLYRSKLNLQMKLLAQNCAILHKPVTSQVQLRNTITNSKCI